MKISLLLLFCTAAAAVQGCTVLELTGAGFAANAVRVMHAYTVFLQNNGTFYVDSAEFQYKCGIGGGWHEFFDFALTDGNVAPYSAEMDDQENCAKYSFHDLDIMLHNMNYGWFSIDTAAAKKVICSKKLSMLRSNACVVRDIHKLLCLLPLQVWKFTAWVQDELDHVLEELSQMPAPRMGFHIRGGDKISEDVQLVR